MYKYVLVSYDINICHTFCLWTLYPLIMSDHNPKGKTLSVKAQYLWEGNISIKWDNFSLMGQYIHDGTIYPGLPCVSSVD